VSLINVSNLTFYYDGSFTNVFENASFAIDTNWKLGFVGRNGKGKTTFLKLLMGDYSYRGVIDASVYFDYFPYEIDKKNESLPASDFIYDLKPGCEEWKVICELSKLKETADILYRPFNTLSPGEKTKILLAVLFSGENEFLLIDEPTNHLDVKAREIVKEYLAAKKGFILVSHDRELLDECTDHCLVLNRKTIEVCNGNFTSWWEQKQRKDRAAISENEKHKKEIEKLHKASQRTSQWADKNEKTKIGFDPLKEPERNISTRSYIGAKTKKMQSRVKQMENRINREIEEKEGLLVDIEKPVDLKLFNLKYHKSLLIRVNDCSIRYKDSIEPVFKNLGFDIHQGERVAICGANGSGKSTIIKVILCKLDIPFEEGDGKEFDAFVEAGEFEVAKGLKISYLGQETGYLSGNLKDYCHENGLDFSMFLTLLRQLDFERSQFEKNMEDFSQGQKKKVLLATSLLTPAHLYIWDEPLNYIDVFSRIQIENLILKYKPTLLFVEHDNTFSEKIATKIVKI